MAVSGKIRQKQYRARQKVRRENVKKAVQKAIDTMPPEYAADCKLWISPPAIGQERPRINWDMGAETHALTKAHAESHGVSLDEVMYEIGVQFCIKRPHLYWAMKSAKIKISPN